jgi:hypothetical protein
MMRGTGPTVFAEVKHNVGVDDIVKHLLQAYEESKHEL